MKTNSSTPNSFVDYFNGISKNLEVRYSINMHLDFIQEFIKFADNTRDIELQNLILDTIKLAENSILIKIKSYEDENKDKKDTH